MAKIVIEFDTNDKTLGVSIDGTAVENVANVYVSKSYDRKGDYGIEIGIVNETTDDDIRSYTRIVAAESEKGRQLSRAGAVASTTPGFVTNDGPGAALELEMLEWRGLK